MRSGRSQQGFFYIGLLIFVAVVAIGLSAVSEVWILSGQRQREEELLFVGDQYRQAITRYYMQSPRAAMRFPMQLDDLLLDTRNVDAKKHYLRQRYVDPMTGKADWGEVTLADGTIVGVYSRSLDHPIKTSGFRMRDAAFEDQTRYADWVFRSPLPAANPVLGAKDTYSGQQNPQNPAANLPPGPIRSTPNGRQPPPILPGLH